MLQIDGSRGEGGGQMLRTSLALALVTGQPVRVTNIRAGRSKPGLMRQHLTAVRAAATVSDGSVEGAAIGATDITFRPGTVRGGEYHFSVGTAGSTMLVLQTILPALMLAKEPSSLLLEGGTHNPHSPPFDFLVTAFLPLIRRMGPVIEATLEKTGFYPAGGGRFRVGITPCPKLESMTLLERGELLSYHGRAAVASLPRSIADREIQILAQHLKWDRQHLRSETISNAEGPGNVILVELHSANVSEVITGFGERGVSAETVAERVAAETLEYLTAEIPVGIHLADQLLLPLALAGGGAFRSLRPSSHAHTQAEVIHTFLGIETKMSQVTDKAWHIEVGGRRA